MPVISLLVTADGVQDDHLQMLWTFPRSRTCSKLSDIIIRFLRKGLRTSGLEFERNIQKKKYRYIRKKIVNIISSKILNVTCHRHILYFIDNSTSIPLNDIFIFFSRCNNFINYVLVSNSSKICYKNCFQGLEVLINFIFCKKDFLDCSIWYGR